MGAFSLLAYLAEEILSSITQVDGGTYFCRASNDVGTSDELAITFTVRYEPRNIRNSVLSNFNRNLSRIFN